jgi:hypothetical protein
VKTALPCVNGYLKSDIIFLENAAYLCKLPASVAIYEELRKVYLLFETSGNGRDTSMGKRALIFLKKSDYEHTLSDIATN